MRISAEHVPSLRKVAPRHLKLVTFTNFLSFVLISVLMSFVLLAITLLFSMLTSIPDATDLSTTLFVRSESSSLLPPRR